MLSYKNVNVNPKHRKTGDCCVRAICSAVGISYDEAIDKCAYWAKKKCYGITDKQTVELVLKEYGYIKMPQPRKGDNTKYLVKELDEVISKKIRDKGVLVTVANHHTAIICNDIIDIWDCGDKSVGNYYIKTN